MGNFTSKLTSLATLSIQDGTPQSKIQHGSSTTGLDDPPQGEWIAVHHPELDRNNNNKMSNKVSAAQSASKASAPLGPITQAAIKAYKAKQQELLSNSRRKRNQPLNPGCTLTKCAVLTLSMVSPGLVSKTSKTTTKITKPNLKPRPTAPTTKVTSIQTNLLPVPMANLLTNHVSRGPSPTRSPSSSPKVSTTTRATPTMKTTCPSLISFVKLTIFMVESLCFLSLFTLQVLEKTKSRSVSTSTTQ